jgi:hypothetical protein
MKRLPHVGSRGLFKKILFQNLKWTHNCVAIVAKIFGVITMFWLPVLLQIPVVSLHLINDFGVTEFIVMEKVTPTA